MSIQHETLVFDRTDMRWYRDGENTIRYGAYSSIKDISDYSYTITSDKIMRVLGITTAVEDLSQCVIVFNNELEDKHVNEIKL